MDLKFEQREMPASAVASGPPARAAFFRRAWLPAGLGIHLIFALSILGLLFFVALPLAGIAWQSFRDDDGFYTLENYSLFLGSARLLHATMNTLLVAIASGIGSVLIATPLAFGVTRTGMRGKRLVHVATIITFASPAFLVTLAYVLLAGPNEGFANQIIRAALHLDMTRGPLNILSVWGFILLSLPQTTAFAFLIMVPAFQNMDLALEEASRISGIGPIETIFRITIPVMRASIFAGGLLAFSTALAEFATPYILGVDVLTVSMRSAILSADFSKAAAIAAISAVLSLVILILYRRSIRASLRYRTISGRGVRVGLLDIGWARHGFTALGLVYALLGAILPSLLLILISFMKETSAGLRPGNLTLRNYQFILETPLVRQGIEHSLMLGVSAATTIALLGFLLAYIMTRTTIIGRGLVDYLSILPLGIAGVAFGVGTIIVNLETPMRGLQLYGTMWILLIAYVGRYIPFGVRSAQVALLQLSAELEEASRVTGSGPLRTIWRISLPLVRPAIAYAWVFGFVQAFTEVSASSVLSGAQNAVGATALLNVYDSTFGLQRACAVGVVMFVVTMALVTLAQKLGGRSFGVHAV